MRALLLLAGTLISPALSSAETPITGEALKRASAVAIAHVGGGRVTDTEIDDEEGYYEVEVRFADGREVDVHLDANFKVLGAEGEDEEESEVEDEAADDDEDEGVAAASETDDENVEVAEAEQAEELDAAD
jgi:hypothetical protein